MARISGIRRMLGLPASKERVRIQVEEEIAFHVEERTRELVAGGMDPGAASQTALREFGSVAETRAALEAIDARRIRRAARSSWWKDLGADLRYGARTLRRDPGFAAIAVLTLAFGIGANATAFGLMEATLLRAPAVRAPESLAAVYTTCRRGDLRCASSYPDYLDYRQRTPAFADLAGYSPAGVTFGDATGAEVVTVERVTGNYFELLGVPAARGRVILPSDDELGGNAQVAVLSHAFWRRRLGSDPDIVGRSIQLNDAQFTVVGVAHPSFGGLRLGAVPALWAPLHSRPALSNPSAASVFESRGSRWIGGLVARLRDGVSVERARAELRGVSDQLAQEYPAARGARTVTVDPLPSYLMPPGTEPVIKSFVWVLQGVVGFTLLLACANLANLLLARGSSRSREFALRKAIGAGRWRLTRQLLSESALLSGLGAAVGVGLAGLALRLVGSFELPFGFAVAALDASINSRVVVFTAILAVATVAAFGTLPALLGARGDVAGALREVSSTGGPRFRRLLGALVTVQVALCVVLLMGAGLFLRTLRNQLSSDLGFREDGIAWMVLNPSMNSYDGAASRALGQELVLRVGAIPGVEAASAGTRIPILRSGAGAFVEVDGYDPAADEEMRVEFNYVAPDYFRTLGLPILRGREFTSADGPNGQRVMVINEEMARAWWPGRDPIGGTVHFREEPHTVVGIARNAAWRGLETSGTAYVYAPLWQNELPGATLNVIARTSPTRLGGLLPLLRQSLREIDPRIAVADIGTMRDAISTTLAPQRAGTVLLSGFAALALVLASLGIYGVIAYGVAQRRREFGIRSALGAPAAAIISLVIRGIGTPLALGALVGLVAAAALGRTLRSLIVGVDPGDPIALLGTLVLVSVAAGVATVLPARRALGIDPKEVMRAE